MKTTILILTFISLSLSNCFAGRFFFEPQIVSEYMEFDQQLTGTSFDGKSHGYSFLYGGGLTAYYKIGRFYIFSQYDYLLSSVKYQDSTEYSHDNSWSKSVDAKKTDLFLGFGFGFKLMAFSFGYSPISSFDFKDHYIAEIDRVKFSGNAFKISVSFPISNNFSLKLHGTQSTYNKAETNSQDINLPGSLQNYLMGELKTTSYGLSLGYLF